MLARRELSEAQVFERLKSKGFSESEIASAIKRLRSESVVDDRRTAASHARKAAEIKKRGRLRTLRELRALGISPTDALKAVADAYEFVDELKLLENAISKRLNGTIGTRAEFKRLYQALIRQGFESGDVMKVLTAKSEDRAKPINN